MWLLQFSTSPASIHSLSSLILFYPSFQIVLVSTSAHVLQGHETGSWLEELAAPYYLFLEQGFEVIIASPKGGPVPLDKNSLLEGSMTEPCKKFLLDATAMGQLFHTQPIDSIDFTKDVDAIYMAGGHGTCVDFINNPALKQAIETVDRAGKVVAADCHGPICFADCTQADGVTPLVHNKVVTGFSNAEEDAVKLTPLVPFLIESRFVEQGAKYEKAESMWAVKVCVDGNLVTGQNPGSSEACAAAVIDILKKN